MKLAEQCFVCSDEVTGIKFCATFFSEPRPVCGDCALGIRNGSEILAREGVKGEFLGKCGDNDNQKQP